jgi:gamma-glutamyltranspeptidase/glutathione hydrolase
VVIGESIGAAAGERVLAAGGNAVDAAVTAALTACVATPDRCNIGAYGGHMVLAVNGGRKVVCIDFNSMAPAAARPDMYPLDARGEVQGQANRFGWLAAGVPGVLAGLALALERYGTRTLREVLQPAIHLADEGSVVDATCAQAISGSVGRLRRDPGSAKLYFRNEAALQAGDKLRNPDLARLLISLAKQNLVEPFYRGEIAQQISDAFQKHGGLVTAKDLAAYQAREVEPLQWRRANQQVFTAPLTAGGLTIIEILQTLETLKWKPGNSSPAAVHARLEAQRLAWKDRLELLGDPEKVNVPIERLLSVEHAHELAATVEAAAQARKPAAVTLRKNFAKGTTHLSAADRNGNMVAVTLTQGGSFGAQVTVEGLGITLGHGMSRFDPRPGHPNAPGPHKRPLHNMCPAVVLREGRAVLAVGAAGGVRIPSAILEVLIHFVLGGMPMEDSVAAPRLHTTGTLEVILEKGWPAPQAEYLSQIGFKVRTGRNAEAGATAFDPATAECRAFRR